MTHRPSPTPRSTLMLAALAARLERQHLPAYDLRCGCGHGDLSTHMKPSDSCRWMDGDQPCGSKLVTVAQ